MEKTIFTQAFGDTPKVRILELLIIGKDTDYSLSDIAEGANVSWVTVLRVMPSLVKQGLVIHTRIIGKAKLFKINAKNSVAALLIKTFEKMLLLSIPEEKVLAKA